MAINLRPMDISVLASAARTTSQNNTAGTGDTLNPGFRGVIVTLDATVNAGNAGSITATIEGKDSVSGKYYTLLAGAAVATVATNQYTIFPGAPVSANVSANAQLPYTWRVKVIANNANAVTYSVAASMLV